MRMRVFARLACAAAVVLILSFGTSVLVGKLRAQQVAGRITAEIDSTSRVTLSGTRPPLTMRAKDIGPLQPEIQLQGMSIVFNRSAAQEADLHALIAAQQNPASPFYHQWLTPDQFGSRFGMSDSDLAKVQSWLQEQGFSIDGVSRSRDRIHFSGTAGQVATAFGTELHRYALNGETHFAPSNDLSVPAALASVVQNVANLSTFRPKPRFRKPKPNFTSSVSGDTFLTPKDVATIYDVNPAYAAGYTGKGQSIAVVGQSSVDVADVENFENALNVSPLKDPTLVFVPGTGNVAKSSGDESESDLDLEYSGGMAPGANIYFVYVGDNPNKSVWDSIQYSVDNDIAPIISDSYGICEPALSAGEYPSINAVLQQGSVQGQSIIVPSGDAGSPDCEGVSGLTTAQQEVLAVDFPASSQYVTAMGGSEFPAADVCTPSGCGANASQYWLPANGTDVIASALKPIPEQVWNDDSPPSNGNPANLSSGGGGVSTLTSRPTWQSGVPGIPSGTMRLVPDVSLSGSPNNSGYLFCSSDTSAWSSGQVASCNSGFRDGTSLALTVEGGTSFDVPIFAGLVALINQKENSVGQGVVSPILYQLASNSTTYASAFHDIKTGNNNCSAAGTTVCPSSGGSAASYSAGTGYDMASGLGSIDFNNLLAAWPAGSSKTASMTTFSAATNAPAIGTNDAITITVASGSGSVTATPTGNVAVLVDGAAPAVSPLTLNSSGIANYTFVSASGGSHVITAAYSGDSKFAPSTSTLVVGNQSFRLTATNPTIITGSAGASTVTITPQEGYAGTISWSISSSPALTNGCYSLPNATVSSSSSVNATLTINTNSKACGGSAMMRPLNRSNMLASAVRNSSRAPLHRAPVGLAMAGLLLAGVFVWRPGKLRGVAGMLLLAGLTLLLPGCGGGSSSNNRNNNSNVAPGTYTLTVVGTDTSASSISGSATVSVTVN